MTGLLALFPRFAGQRGAVAVELAIVFPVILLCVLGMLDFGRAIWAKASLDFAVESAARCAAVNAIQCGTVPQVKSFAAAEAAGLPVSDSAFSVSTLACGIKVSVSFPFPLVVPWLLSGSLTLTASACYPT